MQWKPSLHFLMCGLFFNVCCHRFGQFFLHQMMYVQVLPRLSNSNSLFIFLLCHSDAPPAAHSRQLRVSDETKMSLPLTEYSWNDHIPLVAGKIRLCRHSDKHFPSEWWISECWWMCLFSCTVTIHTITDNTHVPLFTVSLTAVLSLCHCLSPLTKQALLFQSLQDFAEL